MSFVRSMPLSLACSLVFGGLCYGVARWTTVFEALAGGSGAGAKVELCRVPAESYTASTAGETRRIDLFSDGAYEVSLVSAENAADGRGVAVLEAGTWRRDRRGTLSLLSSSGRERQASLEIVSLPEGAGGVGYGFEFDGLRFVGPELEELRCPYAGGVDH